MTVGFETVLPLYSDFDGNQKAQKESASKPPMLTLEFPDSTTEALALPAPSLLLRAWIAVLAHLITKKSPRGILLENCRIDAAWLYLFKTVRSSTTTQLSTLTLQSCRFHSSQIALQVLLQISHWKHLQHLTWNVTLEKCPPSAIPVIWERLIARTARTLHSLEIGPCDVSTMRLVGLGRGWTTAHLGGLLPLGGLPLCRLHLKGCGLDRGELADMVEGLSRQQPCRLRVLNLRGNSFQADCLCSLSKFLELAKDSLRDLNISENPWFPRHVESSSEVDSLEWALSQCKNLEHLSMADCDMSGRVAVQLLTPCRHLRSLSISKNPIEPVVWPTLLQTVLRPMNDLRRLDLSGTLLGASHDYMLSFIHDNNSLEEVHLPCDIDALIAKRVEKYFHRNQLLRHAQSLATPKLDGSATWAAAYKRFIPRQGQGVFHQGRDSSSFPVATPPPQHSSCQQDRDEVSEITLEEEEEDWSQVDALQCPMSVDEYSIIGNGIL